MHDHMYLYFNNMMMWHVFIGWCKPFCLHDQMYLYFNNMMMWHVLIGWCKPFCLNQVLIEFNL